MKIKILLTILLSLSIISPCFPQLFEGGFFAGFTASQIDGDTYSGYNKPGITAGAYISRDLQNQLNWKAELRYTQRGAYNKGNIQNPSLYKLTLHYIELPLILQYEALNKVILEIGLSPELYLFHREEDEYGVLRQEDYPEFHPMGIGGLAGVNYKLTNHIIAGTRYCYSIIPIRDHASGQTYLLNRGQYSNVISLNLFYHFK